MAEGMERAPERRPTAAAIVAVCVVSLLYLVFVVHYSVDGLLLDDWGFVHLIHSAVHGHLTFTALWTQHNENRMFFPNAMLVALGVVTHDNTRTVMIISALLFIASFVMFLRVLSNYLGRRLTVIPVIATGALWFSLTDWQNALWGFQFAWYLIMFLLMAMLTLLLVASANHRRAMVVGAAMLSAIVASYSSAQGEFLWPVGLLCLWWSRPGDPRKWARRTQVEVALWIAAATVTTVVYFLGFTQTGQGDILVTLRHAPLLMTESVLANIGEVIPTNAPDVSFHVVLGTVLLVAAVFVVVQSFRQRGHGRTNPLPVCLILFALLFDPPIASIRLLFGIVPTLAPRYTMANLLIPIAIVTYVLSRTVSQPHKGSSAVRREFNPWPALAIGLVACFVAVQVVVSTSNGITRANESRRSMIIGSRLVVNQDVFHGSQGCFAYALEKYAGEVGDPQALAQAQQDRLSMFSAGHDRVYRTEGLPSVCP